jgi:hypothetical protein
MQGENRRHGGRKRCLQNLWNFTEVHQKDVARAQKVGCEIARFPSGNRAASFKPMFQTGIAVVKEGSQILVAAATWYKSIEPTFTTRGLTLEYMKDNLAAIVIVRGDKTTTTINTACNRTIESLLIKRMVVPSNPPKVELLIKPALSKGTYVFPHSKTTTHWLLTAAEYALTDWLRGAR